MELKPQKLRDCVPQPVEKKWLEGQFIIAWYFQTIQPTIYHWMSWWDPGNIPFSFTWKKKSNIYYKASQIGFSHKVILKQRWAFSRKCFKVQHLCGERNRSRMSKERSPLTLQGTLRLNKAFKVVLLSDPESQVCTISMYPLIIVFGLPQERTSGSSEDTNPKDDEHLSFGNQSFAAAGM